MFEDEIGELDVLAHPIELDEIDDEFLDKHLRIVQWYWNLQALLHGDTDDLKYWRALDPVAWYFLLKFQTMMASVRERHGFDSYTQYTPSLVESIYHFAISWHQENHEAPLVSPALLARSMIINQLQETLDSRNITV